QSAADRRGLAERVMATCDGPEQNARKKPQRNVMRPCSNGTARNQGGSEQIRVVFMTFRGRDAERCAAVPCVSPNGLLRLAIVSPLRPVRLRLPLPLPHAPAWLFQKRPPPLLPLAGVAPVASLWPPLPSGVRFRAAVPLSRR